MNQHSPQFLKLVTESKKSIQELTSKQLKEKIASQKELVILDVREDTEWTASKHIPAARHLSKGVIERDIEKEIPNLETQLVVYCSGGFRSALVANNLQLMGYTQVYSLDGGLKGWVEEGNATE